MLYNDTRFFITNEITTCRLMKPPWVYCKNVTVIAVILFQHKSRLNSKSIHCHKTDVSLCYNISKSNIRVVSLNPVNMYLWASSPLWKNRTVSECIVLCWLSIIPNTDTIFWGINAFFLMLSKTLQLNHSKIYKMMSGRLKGSRWTPAKRK